MRPVYLDYNATTPTDPRVVEAMLPYYSVAFGNAASVDHAYGHEAQTAVERARQQIARLIGARPYEIVLTSGATEANNLALLGTIRRASDDAEVVVSAIEHPAVLEPAATLGDRLKVARVDADGVVDPAEIERLITPRTALVSVMAANNETGALQPINDIGAICASFDVPFHSDAAQAAGRLAVDVDASKVDLLSLSAHKLYGPPGIGALFVRKRGRRARVAPLHFGGGQENNLRPGTTNVPGVVGFAEAAALVVAERTAAARESELRARLLSALRGWLPVELTVAGSTLPQTLSLRFPGVSARALMQRTQSLVAFSSGSACATTKSEPSHVLLAQGFSPAQAEETVRLSFGRFTTEEEIDDAAAAIGRAACELRQLVPTR